MPNLVESVKEMIKRGMPEREIKQNLQELGVDDPDSVYSQAAKSHKTAPAHEASLQATSSVSRLAAEARLPAVDLDSLERKIEDLEAQVKAVSEIMQKILDTDKKILLKLK